MRKTLALLLVLAAGAAVAAGLTIDTGLRYEFTDCASGGSAAQTLVGSADYLFRVTDSDTFVCDAATCATGGEKFPVGTVILIHVPPAGSQKSCRSTGSTGDAIYTRAF